MQRHPYRRVSSQDNNAKSREQRRDAHKSAGPTHQLGCDDFEYAYALRRKIRNEPHAPGEQVGACGFERRGLKR